MNLLIVDDHSGLRSVIRQIVEKRGDCVVECSSAEQALGTLPEFTPDWAIIDYRLGGMSGVSLVRSILMMHPKASCIVISSYELNELSQMAQEAGAVAFVPKENLRSLSRMIGRNRAQTPRPALL